MTPRDSPRTPLYESTQPAPDPAAGRAVLAGCTAYLIWGVVGGFFAYVTRFVSPLTLLSHRVIWSVAFVFCLLVFLRQTTPFFAAFRSPRMVGLLAITSVLVCINWLVFIYAASVGKLVPASLGYFLTPIMNVLLGVVVLKERLRGLQVLAVCCAAVGVGLLMFFKAQTLWIPFSLMITWSFYALLRKQIKISPIVGLGVETTLLLPLAVGYVIYSHGFAGVTVSAHVYPMLIAAGVITAIPLMLFAFAARQLKLSTLGLMQYIGPTVQFAVAILFLNETVSWQQVASFSFIWAGLIVFSADSYRSGRRL